MSKSCSALLLVIPSAALRNLPHCGSGFYRQKMRTRAGPYGAQNKGRQTLLRVLPFLARLPNWGRHSRKRAQLSRRELGAITVAIAA